MIKITNNIAIIKCKDSDEYRPHVFGKSTYKISSPWMTYKNFLYYYKYPTLIPNINDNVKSFDSFNKITVFLLGNNKILLFDTTDLDNTQPKILNTSNLQLEKIYISFALSKKFDNIVLFLFDVNHNLYYCLYLEDQKNFTELTKILNVGGYLGNNMLNAYDFGRQCNLLYYVTNNNLYYYEYNMDINVTNTNKIQFSKKNLIGNNIKDFSLCEDGLYILNDKNQLKLQDVVVARDIDCLSTGQEIERSNIKYIKDGKVILDDNHVIEIKNKKIIHIFVGMEITNLDVFNLMFDLFINFIGFKKEESYEDYLKLGHLAGYTLVTDDHNIYRYNPDIKHLIQIKHSSGEPVVLRNY